MMLRKWMVFGVAGVLLIGFTSFAGTVNWSNSDFWYNQSGSPIDNTLGWTVVCYQVGTLTIIGQATGTSPWSGGDGIFSTSFTSGGGVDVFTRIYNAAAVGDASWYVNVDSSHTIPSLGGTDSHTYTLGATLADGTDWVAVPEPGTFALFGLGLLTIAARRRFRK